MSTPDSCNMLAKRVANKLGRPFGKNPYPRAFANPLASGKASGGEVFDRVYLENYWGSAQSRSGVGSETTFTENYRKHLQALLVSREYHRLFDAPCGDLNWMRHLIADTGIAYAGGDISALVVEEVRRQYPQIDVRVFDITSDAFPDADVWHCRDCLFHLPFAAIRAALENFVRSQIPFALLTTHKSWLMHRNLDVPMGGFRFLDLQLAPMSLPPALAYLPDYRWGRDFPRYVGLWSREQIAAALADWQD